MKTLECRGITLSDKQTKICVPITGTDLEEIKEQAEKIANMNPDVVEWRADFYDVKDNDETEFEQCLKAINDLSLIHISEPTRLLSISYAVL